MISKKTLTVLATIPSWALAQTAPGSTVQIYGRLDAAANYQKFSGGPSVKTLSSDTSLIGFRGNEDLGGGLSSYFKLEHGLQLDTGTQSNATRFWNREALVGLRSTSLGSVQLGIQWSPILWVTSATDPFARSQTGAQFTLFQGTAVRGYLVQYINAVQYVSPNFSGFTARLMTSAPEGAPAKNHGASLVYEQDRLYAAAVYDDAQSTGATVGLPSEPTIRSRTWALGATYRFDFAKLFAYVQSNRVAGLKNSTGALVGATVPVGASEIRISAMHTNRPNANASLFAVGYSYYLSKRTQVYTSAARLNNDGAARFGVWPGSQDIGASGLPAAGQDVGGFEIGMRHTF